MVVFKGEYFGNAETTIDYVNKEVTFNYPNKNINQDVLFFSHSIPQSLSFLCSFILLVPLIGTILNPFLIIVKSGINNAWIAIILILSILSIYALYALLAMVFMIPLGHISLYIHNHSKKARDCFPHTNAIINNIGKTNKTIYLIKPIRISKSKRITYLIHENKLFLFDYEIVSFDYEYEGDNELLKITTKSIEKPNHKGEHYEFMAIFEFKDNITEGKLTYR